MAASMVGGAFLSAFLQVLFDRMASREILDFFCFRKLNIDLLKKLKLTLLSIKPLLDDAEDKQITDPAVKEWLDELKDAVYIAEDLLDEIAFEASRCLLEAQDKADSSQDASVAKLKDKKYIKKLSLEWSGCTSDSQIAREILDNLQPHRNLQELVLAGYGGTRFPDWLGAQSLPNLVFLCLCDCDFCVILPPLGQLPSLKELCIKGMKSVVAVGPEFYGNCSVGIQSFQCLEILKFSGMEQWQDWFFPDGEYSTGVFARLRELYIAKCDNVKVDIPFYLPFLEKLLIDGCQKLGASLLTAPPNNCCYEFLTDLEISWSLKSFPFDLFPNLRHLDLISCRKLESLTFSKSSSFHELKSLSTIRIEECPNFYSFPAGEFPAPNLKFLILRNCCKLKSLPESMHRLLPSLGSLNILKCPDIDSFPEGGLPFSLSCISIRHCDKLFEQRMKWDLQRLTHLASLSISSVIEDLESFPDEGLLPSWLERLYISECPNLRNLDGLVLGKLTSLQELGIYSCPEIQRLPEEGLPTSLTYLKIQSCPILEKRCQREEGKDWQKIAHIPGLDIGY
ncbi:putative disease resistance RPP13-like protein 1 [Carica papaya]|uniref:putative disease resistance RPP13-like protein 1 n=1 Tax=Carica papaya TaxID=3649 RepID=UPI000B8CA97A|nr:putative disease resistance RPP13-like protein 1 [Carica papaya]